MIDIFIKEKKYKEVSIIKNFYYHFEKKGLYLISGESGKGKTTLLNIISEQDKNYFGSLNVDDTIFYLKDKENLVSSLTVKENYKIFEMVNNLKIKDYLNISKLLNKKVRKLSLGELQLVSFNLILNSPYKILLMDEPFSALSSNNKQIVFSLLKELGKNKLIIFTHHEKINDKKIVIIDLSSKQGKKKKVVNESKQRYHYFKFKYYLNYLKNDLLRKLIFLTSIITIIYSSFSLNVECDKYLNEYALTINEEGTLINRQSDYKEMNEDLFYEVVKELKDYVYDYNINYYSLSLQNEELFIDNYYIDNASILSSINYIEETLNEDEYVLGLNYQKFCLNNKISYCDEEYLKTLLNNKIINNYALKVKNIIESEETIILKNKRFIKIEENTNYIEYYIVVKNSLNLMKIITNNDLLNNFTFNKVAKGEEYSKYVITLKENKKYSIDNEYEDYTICLSKGYDCSNYLQRFTSLITIEDSKEVQDLIFKPISNKLNLTEIIISSNISDKFNKSSGDYLELYFEYDNKISKIKLLIKDIIENDEDVLYQNSKWSYYLFEKLLNYSYYDLQIESLIIYENINDLDYQVESEYIKVLKELKEEILSIKEKIFLLSIVISSFSLAITLFVEIFHNKFKKEYFNYLSVLNVKKRNTD